MDGAARGVPAVARRVEQQVSLVREENGRQLSQLRNQVVQLFDGATSHMTPSHSPITPSSCHTGLLTVPCNV